jgi:hypothetical protein
MFHGNISNTAPSFMTILLCSTLHSNSPN